MTFKHHGEIVRSIRSQHRAAHWQVWLTVVAVAVTLTALAAREVYIPGDIGVARFIQTAHDVKALEPLSQALYQFGLLPLYPIVGLAAAGLVVVRAERPLAGAFVVMAMLARPLGTIVKELVERPRPTNALVPYVEGASGFSFPSGHVFGTVLLVGFIWYVLIEKERDARGRIAITVLAVVVGLLMGLQRVYAGAHWPSDVLAGYLWGGVVLFVLIQSYRTLSHVATPQPVIFESQDGMTSESQAARARLRGGMG